MGTLQHAISHYVDVRLGLIGDPRREVRPADAEYETMKKFGPILARKARGRVDPEEVT